MQARIVGQLRVEGAGEHAAFADRHRVPVVGGEHLHLRAVALDPGRPDEDGAQRLVADSLDLQIGLEALQLAPEGVAGRRRVDQAQVRVVADDHPGAGAENGPAPLAVRPDRGSEVRRLDPHRDRRALAARGSQARPSPSRSAGTLHLT